MTTSNRRPLFLATLALVSSSCAVGALAFFLSPGDVGTPVRVLAQPIGPGETLDDSSTRIVSIPHDALPADALDVDAPLPPKWSGGQTAEGTILSESVLSGSAVGRSLAENEALTTIVLDASQIPPLEAGDTVELWGFSENCDRHGCPASLLTKHGRISSIVVNESQEWASFPTARIDVIVDRADVQEVLGHAGNRTLSLALRSPDSAARDASG